MKILIVDDNRDMTEALSLGFRLHWPGCRVLASETGEKALTLLAEEEPDIIILDIALPGMDGFATLESIRSISSTPVIMLTVKSDEREKVRALRLGADDYVTKPFDSMELLARMEAVLRRSDTIVPDATEPVLTCGELNIDPTSHTVNIRSKSVKLTPTEFRILYALARNPNRVIRRDALLARVCGGEYKGDTDFLKVYIKRLRDKLEENPANPQYIITEWGHGYKLACPPSPSQSR